MSAKITKVEIVQTDAKKWVKVTFDNGSTWFPGLIHLGQILSGIGKCEDEKYPNGQGHDYTKRFFAKCWGKTRAEIQELYYADFDPKGTDAKKKGVCRICQKVPAVAYGLCQTCAAAEAGWSENRA